MLNHDPQQPLKGLTASFCCFWISINLLFSSSSRHNRGSSEHRKNVTQFLLHWRNKSFFLSRSFFAVLCHTNSQQKRAGNALASVLYGEVQNNKLYFCELLNFSEDSFSTFSHVCLSEWGKMYLIIGVNGWCQFSGHRS
jgi:hypothetical protein